MTGFPFYLGLAILALCTNYGLSTSVCSSSCSTSSTYQFESGFLYNYDWELKTQMQLSRTDAQSTWIKITGQAQIESIGHCDHILKLNNVALSDSDVSGAKQNEFASLLQAHGLVFGMENGRIEQLCAIGEEEGWTLNIKRAILSGLQSREGHRLVDGRVLETDLLGRCPTHYELLSHGRDVQVRKTKQVEECENHSSYSGLLQSTPYVQSDGEGPQSLPLLRSEHQCDQTFRNTRLTHVKCEESHLLKPFGSPTSGAWTTSTLELTYKSQNPLRRAVSIGTVFNRLSLVFDSMSSQEVEFGAEERATTALEQLCVDETQPRAFYQLRASLSAMTDVDRWLTETGDSCQRAKEIVFQALFDSATGAAIRAVKRLIREGIVGHQKAQAWYRNLAFAKHPDTAALVEAQDLVTNGDQAAVLSTGVLIYQYCKATPNCERSSELTALVNSLLKPLAKDCKVTPNNKNQILLHLKALGNAGQFDPSIVSRCFMDEQNPVEVRVAAVEAYRRVSCDQDRSELLDLYEQGSNTELSIASYLGLMQCGAEQPSTISSIIQSLHTSDAENPVANFVYSHLKHLKISNDPSKQKLQSLVENEILPSQFESSSLVAQMNQYKTLDKRWSQMNSGARADAYAVLSDNSYMPRKAMLNFTVDLFGNTINLFEIGGRAQNMDHLLDSLLEQGQVRQTQAKPEASAYLKVFGNELGFVDLESIETGRRQAQSLMEGLMRQEEVEWNTNSVFLDATMTVPTLTGLPLQLAINGTSTFSLKMKGHVELQNFLRTRGDLNLHGYLKPSADVQVQATMTVDAVHTRSALKLAAKLRKEDSFEGSVQLRRGKLLRLRYDTPKQKMEMLNLESRVFLVHNQKQQEYKPNADRKWTTCSGDMMAKLTGAKLCTQLSIPLERRSPLSGPFSLTSHIERFDAGWEHYVLEAKFDNNDDQLLARFLIDTPGSEIDRKIDLKLDVLANRQGLIQLVTPWKKFAVSGSYEWNLKRKMVQAELSSDGARFSALAKLDYDKKEKSYKPEILFNRGEVQVFRFGGSVAYEENGVACDLVMEGVARTPLTWIGRAAQDSDGKITVDLLHENPSNQFVADAAVQTNPQNLALVLNFDYKPRGGRATSAHRFSLDTQMKTKHQETTAVGKLHNTFYPELNGVAFMEINQPDRQKNLLLRFGRTHQEKALEITANLQELSTNGDVELEAKAAVTCEFLGIEHDLSLKHRHSGRRSIESTIALNERQVPMSELWLKAQKEHSSLSVDVGGRHKEYHQQVKLSLAESEPNEYGATLLWNGPGTTDDDLEVELEFKNNRKKEISAQLQFRDHEKIGVDGKIELRPRFLEAEMKWQKGKKEGSLRTHCSHRAEESTFRASVQCGDKHTSLIAAQLKRTPESNSAQLQLDWNKAHEIKGAAILNARGGEAMLQMTTMGRKYSLDGNFTKSLGANGARQTAGGMRLTFADETAEASFQTVKQGARFQGRYRTEAKLQWADKRIDMVMSSNKTDHTYGASLLIKTPFNELRILDIDALCTPRSHHLLNVNLDGRKHWVHNKLELKRLITSDAKDYHGKLTTTTSYTGFEELFLLSYHLIDKSDWKAFKSEMKGFYREKVIRLFSEVEYSLHPKMTMNGKVELESPFSGFETIAASLEHKSSNERIHSILELTTGDGKKSEISLKGKGSLWEANGELNMYCPYIRKTFTVKHEHKADQNGNLEIETQYETKNDGSPNHKPEITIKVEMTPQDHQQDFTINLITDFHQSSLNRNLGWEQLAFRHAHNTVKITAVNTLSLNNEKLAEIELKTKLKDGVNTYKTDVLWDMLLDEKFIAELVLSDKQRHQDNYVKLQLSSTLTEDFEIVSTCKLTKQGKRRVSLGVNYGQFTHELASDFKIGGLLNWDLEVALHHPSNYNQPKQLTWKVATKNVQIGRRSNDFRFNLQTPLNSMPKFQFDSRLAIEDLTEGEVTHTIETKDFKGNSELQWFVQSNSWRIVKGFKIEKGMQVHRNPLYIMIQSNGELKNKATKGQLLIKKGSDEDSLQNMFDLTFNAKEYELHAQVTSQLEQLQNAELHLTAQSLHADPMVVNLTLVRNKQRVEISAQKETQGRKKTVVQGKIQTTIDGYEDFSVSCNQDTIKVDHQGRTHEQYPINCIMNTFQSQKIQFDAMIGAYDFKLQLRTPYENVEHWTFDWYLSQGFDQAQITLKWSNDRTVILVWKKAPHPNNELLGLKQEVEFTSPFTYLEDIKIWMDRESQNLVEIGIKSKYEEKEIKLTNILKLGSQAENLLKLETPFYGWERLEFNYKQTYQNKQFNGRLEYLDYGKKQMAFEVDHQLGYDQKKFSGYFKVYFPYKLHSISKIAYDIEYKDKLSTKVQWLVNNRIITDVHVSLGNNGKMFNLYADNIFQPIEFNYLFKRNSHGIQAESTFCWDLTQHQDSTIHVKCLLGVDGEQLSAGRSISLTVALPTRTVGFKHDLQRSVTNWRHEFEIILDLKRHQKAGYHLQIEQSGSHKLKMWTPIRTVEMNARTERISKGTRTTLRVKPDTVNRPQEEGTLTFEHEDASTRYDTAAHKFKITLDHPTLKHPLIHKTDLVFNRRPSVTTILNVHTESMYSGNVQDKLITTLVFGRNEGTELSANFPRPLYNGLFRIQQHASSLDWEIKAEGTLNQWPYYALAVGVRSGTEKTQIETFLNYKSEFKFLVKDSQTMAGLVGKCEPKPCNKISCGHVCELNLLDGRPLASSEISGQEFKLIAHPKMTQDYTYKVHGKWDHNLIGLGSYHDKVGEPKLVDFDSELHLKAPKRIDTKLHWRPQAANEYQLIANDISYRSFATVQRLVTNAMYHITNGLQSKQDVFINSVGKELDPFVTHLGNEVQHISDNMKTARNSIVQAFNANEFYLTDIATFFSELGETFSSRIDLTWLKQGGEEVLCFAKDSLIVVGHHIGQVWCYAVEQSDHYLAASTDRILRAKRKVTDMGEHTYDMTLYYYAGFKNKLAEQYSFLRHHPVVTKTIDMTSALAEFFEFVARNLSHGWYWIYEQMPWLKDNVVVDNMIHVLYRIDAQLTWLWKSLGFDGRLGDVFENISVRKLYDDLYSAFSKYVGLRDTKFTVYDIDDGKIEAEIHLPISVTSLRRIPTVRDLDEYKLVQKLRRRYRVLAHVKSYAIAVIQKEWGELQNNGWLSELVQLLRENRQPRTNRTWQQISNEGL